MNDSLAFLSEYRPLGDTSYIPDEILIKFEILSCLKDRSARQVLLLRDRECGVRVVMKVAPSNQLGFLVREHEILARLHDRAFPHPVACFEQGGRAFFLREYVPGRSLAECVEDEGPFSEERAAEIVAEVCAVVKKLHGGTPPVVHRDIKPQNLVLSPDGVLHLVDLDAAETLSPDKSEDTMVMGTAATAAPEQFGYRRCDERTDVYAIGMLLTYLITGGYDASKLRGAGASVGIRRLIARSVQFDPSRRFASADQLSRHLIKRRRRPLRRVLAVSAAVLLLTTMAFAGVNAGRISDFIETVSEVAAEPAYQFASPLVEKAVRQQLGRPEGVVLEREIVMLTELNLVGGTAFGNWNDAVSFGDSILLSGTECMDAAQIGSLGDLEKMTRLQRLSLNRLNIRDLRFLSGLPLVSLSLAGNQITDLSPLSGIKTLRDLNIADNPVRGLEALVGGPPLNMLNIGATGITDLSCIADMHLNQLDMNDMRPETDFSALWRVKGLKAISANGLPPEAIEPLLAMKDLEAVTLFFCGITSLEPFLEMEGLHTLNLQGNNLKRIEGIGELKELKYFEISLNPVTDLSPLAGNASISELLIAGAPVSDLEPLAAMSGLASVVASEDQRALIEALGQAVGFSVRYW